MERTFNYKYIINEKKRTIVALSTFAGRPIRGVARCAPNDVWDIEAGKKLAEARCSAKIAHKRLQRAEDCVKFAKEGFEYYQEQLEKYTKYEFDAVNGLKRATEELLLLEKKFQ